MKGGEKVNNKILLALVVILIVAGGYLLFSNQSRKQATTPSTTNTTQVTPGDQNTGVSPTGSIVRIEEQVINVTNAGFVPATVKVKVGTKVVWINKSGAVATVNSADHPTHLVYPPINMGEFKDGTSVQL